MLFRSHHLLFPSHDSEVHEEIIVFSNSGNYTYNPQKWLVDKKEFLTQRKTLKTLVAGNNIYGEMIKSKQKMMVQGFL